MSTICKLYVYYMSTICLLCVVLEASAASMIRPDLLCPRNTFPPCLDPAGIANVPSRHCDSAGCDFDAGQLPDSQGNFADGASQHCSASGLEVMTFPLTMVYDVW